MLGKDSRSCHPHQQGNQEQTKKHDKYKQMLSLMHRIKTHLNGSFGSFVVEGWRYVARELTEIIKVKTELSIFLLLCTEDNIQSDIIDDTKLAKSYM